MDCKVNVHGGELEQPEIDAYIKHITDKIGQAPQTLDITLDGDEVDLHYTFDGARFQRIRRITGYLVGTLDRFNDAKRHEEADRLKHSIG